MDKRLMLGGGEGRDGKAKVVSSDDTGDHVAYKERVTHVVWWKATLRSWCMCCGSRWWDIQSG